MNMTADNKVLGGLTEENKNLRIELGLLNDAYFQLKKTTAKFEESQRAIEEAKDFLANVINSIGDPVFVKDEQSLYVVVNDAFCKNLGMARADIVGKTLAELLPKDQMNHFLAKDREVLSSGQQDVAEEVFTGQGGKLLTIITRMTRYMDKKGNKFLVGVIRDVTDQKRIEGIKNDFISLASHQLRTPLTGHKWLVEALKSERLGPINPAQRERLDSMYQLNQRMIDLVSEMMQVIHLESGKVEFRREPVALGTVIADVFGLVEQASKRRNITLKADFDPRLVPMPVADARWVQSILECLVSNAVEYSHDGSSVSVEASPLGNAVILSVRDTGIGIPIGEQKHVFTRFFRASNAKIVESNGTGLGLAISQMLAKEMNGFITFESVVGQGSVFRLQLPGK